MMVDFMTPSFGHDEVLVVATCPITTMNFSVRADVPVQIYFDSWMLKIFEDLWPWIPGSMLCSCTRWKGVNVSQQFFQWEWFFFGDSRI